MMKQRIYMALTGLMVALGTLAEKHEPYTGSRIFWDTATRKTVFASGGYARMIELQDGRYMAVCESGGICIAFSTNKGATWGQPTRIVTNVNNTPNCVPDLVQLADGTIVVGYNPRPSAPYTEDRRFGIRCKRSTDNGATWSDEIFINDASFTFEDGCWEPSFLELPSGELQCYFADEGPYTNSGEQQISMCRSFDGGQTWGEAVKISYRQGYRDGMPVPILLNGQTIVVAIEDNGWAGYGSFIPTTVRCPLVNNWTRFWVNATSNNRNRSINYDFCPVALGGAPYLRQLPWGETVMSHQSDYGPGQNQMYVYVGNDQAKDFKAMSQPFGQINASDNVLWNSLAVVDTGTVVAVGGVSGHIEMIKGYAVRELFAPYATRLVVDGKQTTKEGYYKDAATQVILGQEQGVRFTADFAYDLDSLYFTTRVYDRTQQPLAGPVTDGVSLLLDIANRCETAPVDGQYRFFVRLDGGVDVWTGNDAGRAWQKDATSATDAIHSVVARSSGYYTMECAIPWSYFGLSLPPVGMPMRAAVELSDCRSATSTEPVVELMPDCRRDASWTYMAFRLLDNGPLGIEALSSPRHHAPDALFDLQGRPIANPISKGIYIQNGRKHLAP